MIRQKLSITDRKKKRRKKTVIVRKLAYERFDYELDEVSDIMPGLKSLTPLAIQCQGCFLLVATLPGNQLDYLIAMSHFLQNRKAIEKHDFRRLCPECQMSNWIPYMSQFETSDSRRWMMLQAKEVDGILY